MRLTQLLTGLLLISLAFTGVTVFLGDLTNTYGITISDQYTGVYDKIQNNTKIITMSNQFEDELDKNESTPGSFFYSWFDQLWHSGWGTLKATAQSVDVANEMIDATAEVPGMGQEWLSTGIKAVIVITITLLVLGIMMKRDNL